MPPRKKAVAKQSPAMNIEQNRIVILRTEPVKCTDLRVYYKNPRVGNIDLIAKSLHLNGQYRAVIVNVGTHTGRKNEVLAGNHSLLAARKQLAWKEGKIGYTKDSWDTIMASFVDVDETQAAKIVLVDNKSADEGTYDDAVMAELFKSLTTATSGTGFSQSEVDKVLEDANRAVDEAIASGQGPSADELLANIAKFEDETLSPRQKYANDRTPEQKEAAAARGASVGEDAVDNSDADELEDMVDPAAELQVVLEMKEDNVWIGDNNWGIPDLIPEMILEKFPEPITTWGGHDATPDDGKSWYLYNYSLGGMKGLPCDRTILGFFTYDLKFIQWWDLPSFYTSRIMAKGVKIAAVPDFSLYYTESRTHHLWGVYKAQWLGRFFQEAGMKVVPRLQFDYTDPNTLEIGLLGIPKNTPTLVCSIQNDNAKEYRQVASKILRDALEEIQPQQFLVYGGNPGWEIAQKSGWKGEMIHAMNYAGVRRGTVFDKKEGAAKLTEKQKRAIREKHGADPEGRKLRAVPDDDDL